MGFGILRVMNDDLVQPKRGFGEHPHRDVEICTYIVDGKLTHKDSMGTKETLGRGAIQFMVRTEFHHERLFTVMSNTNDFADCRTRRLPQRTQSRRE